MSLCCNRQTMVPDLDIPTGAVTNEESTCFSCSNRHHSRRSFRVNRCNSAERPLGKITELTLIAIVLGILILH